MMLGVCQSAECFISSRRVVGFLAKKAAFLCFFFGMFFREDCDPLGHGLFFADGLDQALFTLNGCIFFTMMMGVMNIATRTKDTKQL